MGMRVIIVGAGIAGLSTAWALRRAGHEPHVLEQGPVPNPMASSVDQHRLIRHAYGDQRGYTLMVDAAFAAWERLWVDLGERLYAETGTLAIANEGTDGTRWLDQSAASLAELGRPVTWLTPAELERRFPLLRADGVKAAFHLDTGGTLFAGRIVERLAHHLMGQGVPVRPHARVQAIDPDRARVHLPHGEVLDGDAVIVAAGAWTGRLLPDLAARLVPSRQVIVYLSPPEAFARAWSTMPMVLEIDPRDGLYIVPPTHGSDFATGLKVGDHRFSREGDADADRSATLEEATPILSLARRRIAGFDAYAPVDVRPCFYTVTEDERFVIEPLGARGWVMSACSGHGFKFGAVLGEGLAKAIDDPGAAASLSRWAAGSP